jgi:hypothetical protein
MLKQELCSQEIPIAMVSRELQKNNANQAGNLSAAIMTG